MPVRSKWSGIEGLNRAKEKMLQQKRSIENNKYTLKDYQNQNNYFRQVIAKGYWEEFNIESWSDFLDYCGVSSEPYRRRYSGKAGLNRAIQFVREFYWKQNRLPYSKEMQGIPNIIYRGRWENLRTISDLFRLAGYEEELGIGKWKGKQGLKYAIRTLQESYEESGAIPSYKTTSRGLEKAILRGEFIEFGVKNLNQLLAKAGLRSKYKSQNNRRPTGYYRGEKGLTRVVDILIEGVASGILPKARSSKYVHISSSINRFGDEWGVKNWFELLDLAFLEMVRRGLEVPESVELEYEIYEASYRSRSESP